MDDISGAADISKKFANFLTVSRKFGYNCVYIFHVIGPASRIWQKLFLKQIYIFPASVPHNAVAKNWLTILKNSFAILISQMTTFFKILS